MREKVAFGAYTSPGAPTLRRVVGFSGSMWARSIGPFEADDPPDPGFLTRYNCVAASMVADERSGESRSSAQTLLGILMPRGSATCGDRRHGKLIALAHRWV